MQAFQFGNKGSGSTAFALTGTSLRMLITCTSMPSSMVWFHGLPIGHGHRFIATFNAACTRQIGAAMLQLTSCASMANPMIRRAGIARRGGVIAMVALVAAGSRPEDH